MEWLVPEIFSLIAGLGIDAFRGLKGKYKRWKLEKELKHDLFYGILEKYGNEVYYNDLDAFLSRNKIISTIINNCGNVAISQYKSKSTIVNFYIKRFEEEYPKHKCYHCDIVNLLQSCFEIVFNTLNKVDNEDVRVICNVIKQVNSELGGQLELIHGEIQNISKNLNWLIAQQVGSPVSFDHNRYIECVLNMYPHYSGTVYIERKLFPQNGDKQKCDALSTLLENGKVLVLGEAGYGKTFESITLLRSVCTHNDASELLPVYLPLYEFGSLYTSILDGIMYKTNPFFSGDVDHDAIREWLKAGKLVLIFDGIDDITSSENRTKLIAELKNLSQYYPDCYYFVTSRFNQYHNELKEYKEFYLTKFDDTIVRARLRKEGISLDIPQNYYELFENPLFFEAGIAVLKNSNIKNHFNRSTLFEKLIMLLYGDWSHQKGIYLSQPLCFSEAILLMGEFAYNHFDQAMFSFLEFEHCVATLTGSQNKTKIIGSLISSGIFHVSDCVRFTHKLFKEYCAAYYLFKKLPFCNNQALYISLIQQDKWKEVFIFIAGMFSDIDAQDSFLDFIMQNNLRLYVECINAKNDLCDHLPVGNTALAMRYLSQIFSSYTYIVRHYFEPLKLYFIPEQGQSCVDNKKVCILGTLSEDGSHLSYWFDFLPKNSDDIVLFPEDEFAEQYKLASNNAIREFRNFRSFGINLTLSKMAGDTGRRIAIKLIKSEIKRILDKKLLIESKYLLCERVAKYKKDISKIEDCNDLNEIHSFIEETLEYSRKLAPNAVGHQYGKVNLVTFYSILVYLKNMGVVFEECILPPEDRRSDIEGPHWVWDWYSDEQKIKRVTQFFKFHQESYLEMVEKNFPILCNSFGRHADAPYQVMVRLDLKKNINPRDFASEPSIQYYYIASPTGAPIDPKVQLVEEKLDSYEIFEEIQQSYRNKGKTAHRITCTSALFSVVINTHANGFCGPLSERVYESIESSLEEIFGDLKHDT